MNTNVNCRRIVPLFLISIIMSVAGCGGSQAVSHSLDVAERVMEDRPDSALIIINSIDTSELKKKSQKARYALLKSMALDKNYVDTTTFEVLQPAIDYYLENGTTDEKLRTYYYQGRIYQNRNDRDSAMRSFMRGLEIAKECSDSLTIARTLVSQGILYKALYDIERYADNYLKAARIYKDKSVESPEFECLLNGLNGMIILNKVESADSIFNILDGFDSLDSAQRQKLQDYRLSYTLNFGSMQDFRNLIEREKVGPDWNSNRILNLAYAFYKFNDNLKAMQYLDALEETGSGYDTLKFLSMKFQILEDMGKHESALAVYKDYINKLEAINTQKFIHMNRTMEEKHQLELQAERDARKHARSMWTLMGGISALMLILAITLLILKNIRTQKRLALQQIQASDAENERLQAEKDKIAAENRNLQLDLDNKALEAENLAMRVRELDSESNRLKEILESRQEMPEEVRNAIKIRIEMLNSYLAGYITDNRDFEKAYDQWVEQLTADTEGFMDSNRLVFQASHPEFIKYFEDHGLTTAEINYVCLYAIGLRGKEVGSYMRKRSHVNTSSAIRQKLGIDRHETNIGIYVRKLLREM